MQVIFVDDERRVLTAVERALMVLDRDWECRFANSAQEALAMLAERPADVVVSDMRMPFMDGAELLQRVREQWPATIRIILSGQSDSDATLRMLDLAHQFVANGAGDPAIDDLQHRALLASRLAVRIAGRAGPSSTGALLA